MRIMLDLDGVIVDFVGGLHAALGADYSYFNYPYELGKWNMLGDIKKPFFDGNYNFSEVNAQCTVPFWATLPFMHDGGRIFETVLKVGNPYLLTTPMPNPGSWTGKAQWMLYNAPAFRERLIVTRVPKVTFVTPDSILIDDKDQNIDEFVAAGGIGILVPRPWNKLYCYANESLECVEARLEML